MERAAFWGLCVLVALAMAFTGPIPTSDGLSHLTMAHFMLHAGDPAMPMLARLYEINPHPAPNIAGHWLLMRLMAWMTPLQAENVLQILCLVSLPLSARLLLNRLAPAARWLALFFVFIAFHRLFFYGLYNFSLSMSGCLLCLWAYVRLRDSPGLGSAAALAGLLVLTLLCHAGGWMQAELGVAALAGTELLLALRVPAQRRATLKMAVWVSLALLPSLGAMLLHTARLGSADGTEFWFSPLSRLIEIAKGDPFGTIGRPTAVAALAMGAVAVLLFASGRHVPAPVRPSGAPMDAGLRRAVLTLPWVFLAWALVIPEKAGGGWTHAWRAAVFPLMGFLIACAALQIHRWLRRAAAAVACTGALTALGMTVDRQIRFVAPVAAEFDKIDRMVPAHCAVAPIFSHFKLDAADRAQMVNHPIFNMTNRLELSGDRPVLFKYLARLAVYPVRFKAGADPHGLLYGWEPMQHDPHVYELHLDRYEKASGIPVSYVLLADIPSGDLAGRYAAIRHEIAARFTLIYKSPLLGLELHRRSDLPTVCAAP